MAKLLNKKQEEGWIVSKKWHFGIGEYPYAEFPGEYREPEITYS